MADKEMIAATLAAGVPTPLCGSLAAHFDHLALERVESNPSASLQAGPSEPRRMVGDNRNRWLSPGIAFAGGTPMTDLLLKSSGPVADQYKVLAGDQVVGHIRLSELAPPTTPWRWTLSHGQQKGRRTPTHGYGATREEALQAFARSWHRE